MTSMASLQGLIAEFGRVDRVKDTTADKAAARIQASARAGYAVGKSPDGKEWKRRKDGQLAVQRPAGTVEFHSDGRFIIGTAEDVLKWHDQTRPVFPEGLPQEWEDILDDEYRNAFDAAFGKYAK